MSLPDIATVRDLDLDLLRKSEHYRIGNKVIVRVGNSDSGEPIYITITEDPTAQDLLVYDEALSVAKNVLTDLFIYVVPVGKKLVLDKIEVSGSNVAKYILLIDDEITKVKRTFYGASLNEVFNFDRLTFSSGTILKVKVIHYNDLEHNGDFEATLEGKLKND